uniref:Uncharacterized protein n=1 Tax=Megaselia scalaris TaxID=36166 RepID=T1GX46_MEGSC
MSVWTPPKIKKKFEMPEELLKAAYINFIDAFIDASQNSKTMQNALFALTTKKETNMTPRAVSKLLLDSPILKNL